MTEEDALRARVAVLEALVALAPALSDVARDAGECAGSDDFARLIAARLKIDFALAKVVANSRLEVLIAGFAIERSRSELEELRRALGE
ncbi:MAG: hypothetical protein Q7T73_13005 [Beijerinckiaceae bacterium]|nr:hypothetical protein [Beijerinckiaceae bacterium]